MKYKKAKFKIGDLVYRVNEKEIEKVVIERIKFGSCYDSQVMVVVGNDGKVKDKTEKWFYNGIEGCELFSSYENAMQSLLDNIEVKFEE